MKKLNKLLSSIYYKFKDIIELKLTIPNFKLKNIHEGEKCYILGNGSSLNDFDFALIKDEIVFGCNFLPYHKDFKKLALNYYFEVDNIRNLYRLDKHSIPFKTIIKNKSEFKPYLNKNKYLFKYSVNPDIYFRELERRLSESTHVFLNTSAHKFLKSKSLFNEHKLYFINGKGSILTNKKQVNDISKRVTFLDGSLFTMIATAIYMGFKEIILIGTDYALYPQLQYHFYDSPIFDKSISKEDFESCLSDLCKAYDLELLSILETDTHYRPKFISKDKVNVRHKIINNFAKENDVKIFNIVSEGFESPIYDKISHNYVIKILKNKK